MCEPGEAKRGVNVPKLVPHFDYHLYPPVVLHNLLPYDVQYSLEVRLQRASNVKTVLA